MDLPGWVRDNYKEMETFKKRTELAGRFTSIINEFSLENDSNTPDFILGEYLVDCLLAFQVSVCQRIVWYNPKDKR